MPKDRRLSTGDGLFGCYTVFGGGGRVPERRGKAMVEITVKGEALTILFLVPALVRALRYR